MTIDSLPEDDALGALLRKSRALEDAPEALIQRAIGLWRSPAAAALPPTPSKLRRLVASLRFDSATTTPMAHGLRTAGDGSRQILYFSDGRDIDIRVRPVVEPVGRRWHVTGQVFGPDATGSTELRSGGRADQVAWSELSEFSFASVEPGPCVLLLRGGDWELELPALDLPA